MWLRVSIPPTFKKSTLLLGSPPFLPPPRPSSLPLRTLPGVLTPRPPWLPGAGHGPPRCTHMPWSRLWKQFAAAQRPALWALCSAVTDTSSEWRSAGGRTGSGGGRLSCSVRERGSPSKNRVLRPEVWKSGWDQGVSAQRLGGRGWGRARSWLVTRHSLFPSRWPAPRCLLPHLFDVTVGAKLLPQSRNFVLGRALREGAGDNGSYGSAHGLRAGGP